MKHTRHNSIMQIISRGRSPILGAGKRATSAMVIVDGDTKHLHLQSSGLYVDRAGNTYEID